jgi:hypothetical protein
MYEEWSLQSKCAEQLQYLRAPFLKNDLKVWRKIHWRPTARPLRKSRPKDADFL